jgi:hypothetical protein
MTDYVVDLTDQLHMYHYNFQHIRMASDRMKACYDCLANSIGFQEGKNSGSTVRPEESPKLQPPWEGEHKMIIWINNMINRIHNN